MCNFSKQYEYFQSQPFKSSLNTFNIQRESGNMELFLSTTKQTVPNNAYVHRYLLLGAINIGFASCNTFHSTLISSCIAKCFMHLIHVAF